MDSGPRSATEALRWIKAAVREGRYEQTKHLVERLALRKLVLIDVLAAVQRAGRAEPFADPRR
jgi:hypothetical protein